MSNQKEKELKEALSFLELLQPAFARYDGVAQARQLRNSTEPEWVDNFFQIMSSSSIDPTIDKKTGIVHTVESMVEDLRSRVGLSGLDKKASFTVALSKKGRFSIEDKEYDKMNENQLFEEIRKEIDNYGIKPTSGFIAIEALMDKVKDKFGEDVVHRIGRERLAEFLEKLRNEAIDMSTIDNLPKYEGQPMPIGSNEDNKNDNSKPGQGTFDK